MNMAELYQEMKDALDYLGLSFHEKDKVEVTLDGDYIVFTYNGRLVSFPLPPDKP